MLMFYFVPAEGAVCVWFKLLQSCDLTKQKIYLHVTFTEYIIAIAHKPFNCVLVEQFSCNNSSLVVSALTATSCSVVR